MSQSTMKKDDKFQQGVEAVKDKAQDMAHTAADKAKEYGAAAADKAKELGSQAVKSADSAAATVGDNIKSFAGQVRDNAPREGYMGAAASGVADTLESAGRYLEQHGVSGAADDLTSLIKRHPVPAVLVGIGLGFLLARVTRS